MYSFARIKINVDVRGEGKTHPKIHLTKFQKIVEIEVLSYSEPVRSRP